MMPTAAFAGVALAENQKGKRLRTRPRLFSLGDGLNPPRFKAAYRSEISGHVPDSPRLGGLENLGLPCPPAHECS